MNASPSLSWPIPMKNTERPQGALSAANGHEHCLWCGPLNPRSLHLSFHRDVHGAVATTLQADASLQGYSGILHGGVVASLLDAAMTHCLFHHGRPGLTADLRIRYLQPVPCSAVLDIQAWVTQAHTRLLALTAELRVDSRLMAKADAKFIPIVDGWNAR